MMKINPFIPALCLLAALPLGNSELSAAEKIQKKKLQIFILLGQSNMVWRYPDGFGPAPGAEDDG